jgi:hypothetical protein
MMTIVAVSESARISRERGDEFGIETVHAGTGVPRIGRVKVSGRREAIPSINILPG